jgi:hypothetical protein
LYVAPEELFERAAEKQSADSRGVGVFFGDAAIVSSPHPAPGAVARLGSYV